MLLLLFRCHSHMGWPVRIARFHEFSNVIGPVYLIPCTARFAMNGGPMLKPHEVVGCCSPAVKGLEGLACIDGNFTGDVGFECRIDIVRGLCSHAAVWEALRVMPHSECHMPRWMHT